MIRTAAIPLLLLALLLALPQAQRPATTLLIVHSELIGRTNVVDWRSMPQSIATNIVTINRTNWIEPQERTNRFLCYTSAGTVRTSTNLRDWETMAVTWSNIAAVPVDRPQRFFTAPFVPSIFYPSNGTLR